MKASIAMKVTSIYLVIVIGSLALSGALAIRAIEQYVLSSTEKSLIADGQLVIHAYELYGQLALIQHLNKIVVNNQTKLMVAAQPIEREYVVIDTNGSVLWNTFSHGDFLILSQFKGLMEKALRGRITSGVYPADNPVYEFVAIPFSYTSDIPIEVNRPPVPRDLRLPVPQVYSDQNTKVVALFTRVSDLQRITLQIWLAVAQGLAIASLITAVVGVMLAHRLMRPAAVIKKMIERVRNRDFAIVPIIRTGDEWEDFSVAFAEMVNALRAFDDGQKRFLQNASHELKTPLMAIRGYAEGLRDGVFEPNEATHILDIIADESVRIKRLVDQLIYLSKLETLDELYAFERQDLGMVIVRTIERVHPLAKERHINIIPDIPEERVFAVIDRDKMVQALLNLVSNAIRHARRQVLIRLEAREFLQLIVEDDGEGIELGEEKRVFERFFHGAKGDTGLGLAIAKAIVEKHRGTIEATNAEGRGARFTINL